MTPEQLSRYVVDRVPQGEFTVHRDVFRDPALFELEMRHIFEGTWVFLGFASQIPKPHDYFTTWIGRAPVVVMRDASGKLGAFINSCRHRGALVCHHEQGNAKYHVCNYHGWAYDSAGRNIDVKDRKDGHYSAAFDRDDHDLAPVARFAEYRGILFGSLNAAVPGLDAHLGEARFFLDLVVDQGAAGIELVPGCSTYTFNGNWKLQIENCVDAYHLSSAHPSFMRIVERRKSGESKNTLKALDFNLYRLPEVTRGGFTFDHGHCVIWSKNPTPRVRPLFESIDAVRARVGAQRAEWMLYQRNLTIYPNVQFAENASLQLRIIRPLEVDRTEMRIYCLAPTGESDRAREVRIRQYEDFFNSTGLATPDDTTCYEDCQAGYGARTLDWQQGYARGMTAVQRSANAVAQSIGIHPLTSQEGPHDVQDETIFHAGYREWLRLLQAGFARDAGQPSAPRAAAGGTP
jgi:phenylpropionate dioxygenase-like ring-hydroxylating dioxygenase large terminal subunit